MNNANPHISFVIPAYNAESTLEEAVRSIFAGNFETGDEVIIVDDCSTDDTAAVAERLRREFEPHMTVIRNVENKGCPASRNVGIDRAKNEFIFNLDADNILVSGSVARLKDTLVRTGADAAAFAEYRYFKANPKRVTHTWVCKPGFMTLADFLSGMVNPGPGGNFLYRRKTWKRIGGYWEYGKGLHEAWGFTLKLLINGTTFFVVPNTYYFHRYSHQSLFVRENAKMGQGVSIANKFMAPTMPLLDERSRDYIAKTPDWFDRLEERPLLLKDGSRGTNGRIVPVSFSRKMRSRARRLMDLVRAPRNIVKNIQYALIYAEARAFKSTRKANVKKRVLILRMDHVGDCIIFYPTLRAYREFYKDAELTIAMPKYFKSLSPLLEGLADHVVWFDNKAFDSSFWYRRRFMLGLSNGRFDTLIYPAFDRETIGYFMMKTIGARESIGFDGDTSEHGKKLEKVGGFAFTRLIKAPADEKLAIEHDRLFAENVTGRKITISFPTIDISKLPREKASALATEQGFAGKRYAVVFPGAGAAYRIWPSEKSAEIVDYIASKGVIPVICGSTGERGLVKKILGYSKHAEQAIDLSGVTELSDLAHILAGAAFYFGSDTGILHLAVAVGCPAIATVGAGGLDKFFPYGDSAKNRAIFDRTREWKTGDWSIAEGLGTGEVHPSILNITVADAQKEIDSVLDYLAS